MRFLTLYWWEWAAYAFGFLSITINALWLLTTFREKPMPSGELGLIPTLPNSSELLVRPRGRVTVWIGLPVIALITVGIAYQIGKDRGYGIRDHELTVNTFTYEGVAVNSQVSDHRYWMTIPGYIRQFDFDFCHPIKMPADIIDIKYEQKYACKQVYGVGFVQPHKERNNAAIQNGRYSATASETSARLERGR